MRKYKINRTGEQKLPSRETIEKYKDFSRLSHEYDNLTKRPKVPLYKNKKMFLVLLLIVLMAFLLAEAADEKENKPEDPKTDQVDSSANSSLPEAADEVY